MKMHRLYFTIKYIKISKFNKFEIVLKALILASVNLENDELRQISKRNIIFNTI